MARRHRELNLDLTTDIADYLAELARIPTLPVHRVHDIGATVCAPGHRHRLTVVGHGMEADYKGRPRFEGAAVYHLADERGEHQPYPGVTVPARDVRAYGWRALLEFSDTLFGGGGAPVIVSPPDGPGVAEFAEQLRQIVEDIRADERMGLVMPVNDDGFDVQVRHVGHDLEVRAHYLDACSHLHDLARELPDTPARRSLHETAADMLTEAATAWRGACECDGGTYRCAITDSEMPTGSVESILAFMRAKVLDHVIGNAEVSRDEDNAQNHYEGTCKACNGTGRVSRITDAHRLRLVEALIAAGLPEREQPKQRPYMSWSNPDNATEQHPVISFHSPGAEPQSFTGSAVFQRAHQDGESGVLTIHPVWGAAHWNERLLAWTDRTGHCASHASTDPVVWAFRVEIAWRGEVFVTDQFAPEAWAGEEFIRGTVLTEMVRLPDLRPIDYSELNALVREATP